MNINFTGHNVEVTDALRQFTTDKLSKLSRHYDNITSVRVIFDVEKLSQIAEATVHIPKHEIFARAEATDMYGAIDLLTDKLVTQIKKHKEKERDKH
jgi:putative sigma-54 modulation protein